MNGDAERSRITDFREDEFYRCQMCVNEDFTNKKLCLNVACFDLVGLPVLILLIASATFD